MKDQYGDPIPADLVLLPDIAELTDQEILIVTRASWYNVDFPSGHYLILASSEELEGLSELDPKDCGVGIFTATIERIAEPLKRWSLADGFYHA